MARDKFGAVAQYVLGLIFDCFHLSKKFQIFKNSV